VVGLGKSGKSGRSESREIGKRCSLSSPDGWKYVFVYGYLDGSFIVIMLMIVYQHRKVETHEIMLSVRQHRVLLSFAKEPLRR
jgi:hypothetical protein